MTISIATAKRLTKEWGFTPIAENRAGTSYVLAEDPTARFSVSSLRRISAAEFREWLTAHVR